MKFLFAFFICLWLGESFAEGEQTEKNILYSSDLSLENKHVLSSQEKTQPKLEILTSISSQILLAKNSAFDPFIDYGEFQDDVTEEESINFFTTDDLFQWRSQEVMKPSPLICGKFMETLLL